MLKNLFYIFFPIFVGFIVSIILGDFTYSNLVKPVLSPPGVVFPIVWSILYLLMGISYYLYRKKGNINKSIDIIYYLQLFVNALWSIIFFGFEFRFFAIIWIILLFVLVLILVIKYYKNNNKLSAYLNIPYLLWILFATYLTIGIFILN